MVELFDKEFIDNGLIECELIEFIPLDPDPVNVIVLLLYVLLTNCNILHTGCS